MFVILSEAKDPCQPQSTPPPTPPDRASCLPPPSPARLTSNSAQTAHSPESTSDPSRAPEYPAVPRTLRLRSPVCSRARRPLPSLCPRPDRPAQSARDEIRYQTPAATAAVDSTSPRRCQTPSINADAAESSSPAAHTPTAPDA